MNLEIITDPNYTNNKIILKVCRDRTFATLVALSDTQNIGQ